MKKLNLGSGLDYRQGWINVELNKKLKADLYFDLRKDFPLEKASFDYVLAQDILEHFTKEDAKRFIKECYRVLKVGGVLELRFPNILQIISQFRKDTEVLIKFLYGNTEVAGELGSHKFGYTEKTIRKLLKESDFWVESIEKKTTNFVVVAKKVKRRKAVFSVVFSGLDSGAWGGAEKFLWQLSEEIKTVGVSSSFLVVESSVFCQKLQSDNRKVSTMPMRMDIIGGLKGLIKFFLFLPYATYLLWKKLKQTKTKGEVILVLPGISDKIILTPLARILKIPVVWLEFSPLSDVFKVNFGIPKALYRLVGFLCDTVFIPTNYAKGKLLEETRLSESKIVLSPLGIKILTTRKINALLKRSRKMKLDRWKGKRIVTTVSRLQKEKGQDILINSISDIRKQVPNVKLLVVGEGADRDRLERIVDEKDIRDFVEFLGFVDESEKFAILGLTDVFVFPTRWELEGFGLVSLEAMMMRTPVVATDFGPNREVLGESALLVEGSKNGLSNGISKLLEDSALRKAYERKGQKRVQELSISKTAQTYLDEFEKILKWKN